MSLELFSTSIVKLFTGKLSYYLALIPLSLSFAYLLEALSEHISKGHSEIAMLTVAILMAISTLVIVVDLITGSVASVYEGKKYGIPVTLIMKAKIWAATVGKFLALYLYGVLAFFVLIMLNSSTFVLGMVLVPIGLSILKEYMSIGENIQRITEKENKPYMFSFVDKIFTILEEKVIEKVKSLIK